MGTDLQKIELTTPGKDIESYLACVHSIPCLLYTSDAADEE